MFWCFWSFATSDKVGLRAMRYKAQYSPKQFETYRGLLEKQAIVSIHLLEVDQATESNLWAYRGQVLCLRHLRPF